ncbi:Histidine triad (HIT) nucleotide-binding protein, similarity with At5g48545 and yeast YDL125C (HNT1) [Arthrobacter rhombi]|uniref:Histidine triad (HIT) nucleotide-binding protein, similarity with At5g48545 and yeast YDL125C (HNT1) n=1 Tax=Arthrobacter rhombi TaxID=71253 RepID=A0A1R4GVH1_9MICC|nr:MULTISPECIES: HIT domain-containing protein [Micrococcaceae]PCC25962.1 HIT domain-containing protein [Glutamicibacter sp. BW78]SJM72104.1 Histidine triad (HIT) nucleotide-binding protein, similarity with At5g48545 and yeast YDL125C (HNT1) [Arthrobacter rhombi]
MPAHPYGSHEPPGYNCPFCELLAGGPLSEDNLCVPTDLVYSDPTVAVIMACDGFGDYGGHAMVIPAAHLESLYDLGDSVAAAIMIMTRKLALAMKLAWNPEGTSTRQHNEPAGNQHVWHYHQHVFPRYWDDNLYRQLRHRVPADIRARKATELSAALAELG